MLIGWAATVVGALLGAPQLVRLIRTRSVDGLSLVAWQAMLTVGLSWMVHGVRIGQPPQVVVSATSLVSTVPILVLMAHALHRRLLRVLLPGLIGAAAMIVVDHFLGSMVYGLVAIIPAVISNAGQSVQFVRAPSVLGVSTVFVVMACLNQCLWAAWATMIGDPGSMIAVVTALLITSFNLFWYSLRRLGVGARFATTAPAIPDLILTPEIAANVTDDADVLRPMDDVLPGPPPRRSTPGSR